MSILCSLLLADYADLRVFSGASNEQPAPEKPDEEMKDAEGDSEERDVAKKVDEGAPDAEQAHEKPKEKEKPQVEPVKGEATGAEVEDDKTKDEEKPKETEAVQEKQAEEAEPTESKEEPKPAETQAEQPKEEAQAAKTNGHAVEPGARDESDIPPTILEKGVIYFFFRSRVNVDDPQDVNDVARSFLLMRPIPLDAKLGDGPIGDEKNCRLLALPKKVLPKSGKDRFVTFVEKFNTSFAELKDDFLTGSEYETKTQGTRHTAPVTPLAEGIYAITSSGRDSHLAYIINIPSELGEVQKDFGLKERGSFVASVKNPDQPPTGNQQNVPPGAKYPPEIIDEFRGLRWKPLEPKYLDYDGASFLIIGEDFEKATEQRPKDDREGNANPSEELEKLEGEDEIRIKHLKGKIATHPMNEKQFLLTPSFTGDDAIFADLHVTMKDIPEVRTTW